MLREEEQAGNIPSKISTDIKLRATTVPQLFFANLPKPPFFKSLLVVAFLWLLKKFESWQGVRLLVEVPKEISFLSMDTWQYGRIIRELQKAKVLSHIEKLPNFNGEPQLYRYHSMLQGLPSRFNPFNGIGHSLYSESEALITSIGEAVERYCYRHYLPSSSQCQFSSYHNVKGRAVNPSQVVGLPESVRQQSSDPTFQKIDGDTKFTWVKGRSLLDNHPIWLPLQLISGNALQNRKFYKTQETTIRQSVSTGAAVGQTKEAALFRGVCEVIERDAFMITYLKKLSPPKINVLDLGKKIQDVNLSLEKHSLEVSLLHLPTDFPVHVVAAFLRSKHSKKPLFTIGFKTDLDLEAACYGAMKESLNARVAFSFMLERLAKKNDGADKEHQYGEKNLYSRTLNWLTDDAWYPKVQFLTEGEESSVYELNKQVNFDASSQSTFSDKLSFLKSHLKQRSLEAVYVENTTDNLKKACKDASFNLRSFFVVLPSLQPFYVHEHLACTSGDRLQTVPAALGYDVDPDYINPDPHPIP